MLWLRYGLAIRDAPVVLVNGFGAAVACLTMIVYYIYSPDRVHHPSRSATGPLMAATSRRTWSARRCKCCC